VFAAFESAGDAIRLSWFDPTGAVLSTTDIPAVVTPLPNGTIEVRAVYDPDAPRGIREFWLHYGNATQVVAADGTPLWNSRDDALNFPSHDIFVPDGDAMFLLRARPDLPRLTRVDASGHVVWERKYSTESWEQITLQALVPNPTGGYWAVGRLHGGNFSHLLILDLAADGREMDRRVFLESEGVGSIPYAGASRNGLSLLVTVSQTNLRSYYIEGTTIDLGQTTSLTSNTLHPIGNSQFITSAQYTAASCMSSGCYGSLGGGATVLELSNP